ncbi:MAG: protein translocase subunit SecD, partial [Ignavibacteriaceae bacterium]|nr:protein translocase subunit SecD [Ignavibacteriaceae bacterium]
MKEFRLRLIIIVAAIALSIYLLYPTYLDYQNSSDIKQSLELKKEQLKKSDPDLTKIQVDRLIRSTEDSILAANPDIVKDREKRIKLGLDLQGGMRVVLEVNTGKLLEKLAKNPDETFRNVLAEAQKESERTDESVVDITARKFNERGIRLSRYFGTIRDEDDQILTSLNDNAEDAVTRAVEIIRNRVDQYGVSEPSIQRQGSRRIIVELPGVAREEEAKKLLQGTALLEFRIVREADFTFPIMQKIDDILAGKVLDDTTLVVSEDKKTESTTTDTSIAATDTTTPEGELSEEEFRQQHPFFSIALLDPQGRSADAYVKAEDRDKLELMLNRPDVQKVIPNNVEFKYQARAQKDAEGNEFFVMYMVNKEPELTGGVITDATANIDPNTSAPIVTMTMNSEGATEWARITGANVNKRIAIMLDGGIFSAPVVKGKIPGGRSQIEGMADLNEAKLLEIVLKAGALPAPVDIIEERSVGPSLGEDSINKGLLSVVLGYVLVGFFMILYYRRSGSIAAAALIFTILLILGVLAGFNATLTLPGIAGIILTIGMA